MILTFLHILCQFENNYTFLKYLLLFIHFFGILKYLSHVYIYDNMGGDFYAEEFLVHITFLFTTNLEVEFKLHPFLNILKFPLTISLFTERLIYFLENRTHVLNLFRINSFLFERIFYL